MNQAECRAALHVSGSAARQEVLVPLCDGLLQGDISGHLLRLGLKQGLFLGVRHLSLYGSVLGWGEYSLCRSVFSRWTSMRQLPYGVISCERVPKP